MTLTTYAAVAPSTDAEYQSVLVFECGTGTLISLVSGPYSAMSTASASGPGPDMVYIPEYAVVGSFTASTPLYFDDNANAATSTVMEAGKTLWVFGINAEGTYYQVLLNGVNYWVPVGTMGPNYDEVWNGTPLPTVVVE